MICIRLDDLTALFELSLPLLLPLHIICTNIYYDLLSFIIINCDNAHLPEEHRKAHPNSHVIVAKVHKVGVVVSNYQEAKICLLMHSFKDNCGGEYHRWSEFGAYGCIPVMEQFADTVGIHAYERCGGAVFTNRTHVIQTAASIVEKIDKGLYNNRSQEIVNWWKRGIKWDTILPTVYQVPS